jgi:glycosyltransferase involved in cell wall biosynthesis
MLSKKADFRITPNLTRIDSNYSGKWIEIKNLFEFENLEATNQSTSARLQLFYGGVLSADRGLMALGRAVKSLPQWEFQIFGQGPELIGLQSLNSSRVMTKGLIDHELLMKEARGADLYSALYDPRFSHNMKTASNKLFEAAQLGIPLLTTKDTSLGQIVESHGLGWTVDYDDIQEISEVLTNFGNMGQESIVKIKKNLHDYFVEQLYVKRESLNRLLGEVKRAMEA